MDRPCRQAANPQGQRAHWVSAKVFDFHLQHGEDRLLESWEDAFLPRSGRFPAPEDGAAGVIALNLWIWSWWGTPVLFTELAFTLDSEKQKPCPFPKGTARSVQGAGRDLFTLQLGNSRHHLGICLTA